MDATSIFLGWLLGMLSPLIISRVKRKYSRDDLHCGILCELNKLRLVMACTAYSLGAACGKYDKDFVNWCINNIEPKSDKEKNIFELLNNQLETSDEQFDDLRAQLLNEENIGQSLKKHSLAFADLHISDLSLFSIEFQNRLLEVKAKLAFYNDEVDKAENYFLMTFDSSMNEVNHEIIKKSLINKYQIIQGLSMQVADHILAVKNVQEI